VRPFLIATLTLGIPLTAVLVGGCAEAPPVVQRVPVAGPDNNTARLEYAQPKPLPDDALLYDRK
jgi:hypothetical protein